MAIRNPQQISSEFTYQIRDEKSFLRVALKHRQEQNRFSLQKIGFLRVAVIPSLNGTYALNG